MLRRHPLAARQLVGIGARGASAADRSARSEHALLLRICRSLPSLTCLLVCNGGRRDGDGGRGGPSIRRTRAAQSIRAPSVTSGCARRWSAPCGVRRCARPGGTIETLHAGAPWCRSSRSRCRAPTGAHPVTHLRSQIPGCDRTVPCTLPYFSREEVCGRGCPN